MGTNFPGFLLKAFRWLISAQFIVALSALCLALETLVLAGITIEPEPVTGFIFFGSLSVYNLALLGTSPFKYSTFQTKKQKYITSIAFLITFSFIFYLSFFTLILVFISGFLALIYLYKLRIGHYILQVRNIPLIKNILLAIIWSLVTVFIPLSISHEASYFNENEWLLFIRRFFFILAIAIPFDIRDYREDKQNRLQTLPVTLGIGKAKMLSLISLTFFALLVLYSSGFPHSPFDPLAKASQAFYISILTTAALILLATTARKKYFFSLLLDGTMIFQFVLVMVTLKIWGAIGL